MTIAIQPKALKAQNNPALWAVVVLDILLMMITMGAAALSDLPMSRAVLVRASLMSMAPVIGHESGSDSNSFATASSQHLAKISNEIHNCVFSHRSPTMAAQTSMLHIRVDDDIKEQATAALTTMGLSVSDAVRLFLRRVVVDQAFPLELKVPNAETQAAMEESRAMMASRRDSQRRFASADEMFADLEKNSGK
jgi:DNA-damage-inducible protein J